RKRLRGSAEFDAKLPVRVRAHVGQFALASAGMPEHRARGQVELLRALRTRADFALSHFTALDHEHGRVARMRSRPGRITRSEGQLQRPDAAVFEQHHFATFRRLPDGGFGQGEAGICDTSREWTANLEQSFTETAGA